MTDLLMPKLGLTMSEGLLLEWKVAPGEAFSKGQTLFVVETDKAATDIEAEVDGVLGERLVGEGETVPVGTPVGRLGGGKPAKAEPKQAQAKPAGAAAPMKSDAPASSKANGAARIIATPLARRMARERGIDLSGIAGSGPKGRIKAVDVEGAVQHEPTARPEQATVPGEGAARARPSPTQAAMARRLAEVKHGVPHFYLSTEVEVSALLELRGGLNALDAMPKLTLTHFVLAAVGRSLAQHPNINRVWTDGEILQYAAADVSMAVETETGLYVPVVRNAGSASLDQIGNQARALVERARGGRLSHAEMSGAAIAVSNAGMHDVTWLTPIINPGQSAILGVGSVREIFRPGPDGGPKLCREMGIVFSGDHRVHTGVEGLAFLNSVKDALQNPLRLLRH